MLSSTAIHSPPVTMSAENLDTPIFYEQLEDLEYDFEDVEMELRK